MNYSKILIITILLLGFGPALKAQCKLDYQVKVDDLESASKISLTIQRATSPVQLKLYDIMVPGFSLVSEKVIQQSSQVQKIEFTDLANSTYSILATWNGCFENIGGVSGIRISKIKK